MARRRLARRERDLWQFVQLQPANKPAGADREPGGPAPAPGAPGLEPCAAMPRGAGG